MFLKNSYHNYFFDLALKKFINMAEQQPIANDDNNFSYRISIPYLGNPSHKFGCNLAKFITRKFDFNLTFHYKTVKTAPYFQLKFNIPSAHV